jgi:hypothetical protein
MTDLGQHGVYGYSPSTEYRDNYCKSDGDYDRRFGQGNRSGEFAFVVIFIRNNARCFFSIGLTVCTFPGNQRPLERLDSKNGRTSANQSSRTRWPPKMQPILSLLKSVTFHRIYSDLVCLSYDKCQMPCTVLVNSNSWFWFYALLKICSKCPPQHCKHTWILRASCPCTPLSPWVCGSGVFPLALRI